MKVRPLADRILVDLFKKGERKTKGGIILRDDDGKSNGIRPRWARIYAVGEDIDYVKPGEWIFIEHGRWTHGVEINKDLKVYQVDPKCIMAATEDEPMDELVIDMP